MENQHNHNNNTPPTRGNCCEVRGPLAYGWQLPLVYHQVNRGSHAHPISFTLQIGTGELTRCYRLSTPGSQRQSSLPKSCTPRHSKAGPRLQPRCRTCHCHCASWLCSAMPVQQLLSADSGTHNHAYDESFCLCHFCTLLSLSLL